METMYEAMAEERLGVETHWLASDGRDMPIWWDNEEGQRAPVGPREDVPVVMHVDFDQIDCARLAKQLRVLAAELDGEGFCEAVDARTVFYGKAT